MGPSFHAARADGNLRCAGWPPSSHRQASLALAQLDPVMARAGRAPRPDAHAAAGAGRPALRAAGRVDRLPAAGRQGRRHHLGPGAGAATDPGRSTRPRCWPPRRADLRAAGLSGAKTAAILDLAAPRRRRHASSCDRHGPPARRRPCIDQLVQVRGIGRWTAQMFLIFTLQPPRRVADRRLRRPRRLRPRLRPGRAARPPRSSRSWASAFRPYRSVAAWYCWRAADSPGLTGADVGETGSADDGGGGLAAGDVGLAVVDGRQAAPEDGEEQVGDAVEVDVAVLDPVEGGRLEEARPRPGPAMRASAVPPQLAASWSKRSRRAALHLGVLHGRRCCR